MGLKIFLQFLTCQIIILNGVQCQIDTILLQNANYSFRTSTSASGDIMMAGLFPVHYDHDPFSNICKYLNEQTVQWIQAMIYTIDQINNSSDILPNITVGYSIRDTCDSASLGILQTISAIPNEIGDGLVLRDNLSPPCNCANESNLSRPIFTGIIGGKRSRVSIPIASLVSNFNLPQISYASTSPALTDRQRYKSFFRTVPTDIYQAMALVDIMKHFHWNYVSVIAIDDSYGRQGLSELNKQAKLNDICMAVIEYISDPTDTVTISKILTQIEDHPKSKVIILFTTEFDAINVIHQAELRNLTGYVIISTEAWSNSLKFTRFNPAVVGGMIGISLEGRSDPQFDQYLRTRDLCNNVINPWFLEMWRSKIMQHDINVDLVVEQCSISNFYHSNYSDDFYYQTSKAAYVMDAVKALAVALHNTLRCNSKYCPHTELNRIDRTRLMSELANVTFRGETMEHFRFTASHNGRAKYTIVNLQPDPVNKNILKYVKVGSWNDRSSTNHSSLVIDNKRIIWNGNRPWHDVPSSNCSNDCPPGTVRVINSRDVCCWHCRPCSNLSISNETNAASCYSCPKYFHPNANHTACLANDRVVVRPTSALAISIYVATIIILILICITWSVFIKYRKTAIVKASNFAISNLLLFSISYCSIVPIIFVFPKSRVTCSIALIAFASSLTLTMLSIISKTKTIARIFSGELGKPNGKKKLYKILPTVIPLGICILQICVCAIAIYLDPIMPNIVAASNNKVHIVCSSKYKIAYMLAFVFIALSNFICIYLAFKTRKLPENFNEAKYICFTALIMCCIVVTLIPSFFTTTGPLQDGIAALGCAAFAIAVLLCIFSSRVYVMLFKPELNCREQVILSVTNYAFTNCTPKRSPSPSPRHMRRRTRSRLDVIESSFCNKELSSSEADRLSTSSNHSACVQENITVINSSPT